MLRNFGVVELLIVLAIVVLLLGAGRVPSIAKELGQAITNFKQALTKKDD